MKRLTICLCGALQRKVKCRAPLHQMEVSRGSIRRQWVGDVYFTIWDIEQVRMVDDASTLASWTP